MYITTVDALGLRYDVNVDISVLFSRCNSINQSINLDLSDLVVKVLKTTAKKTTTEG